MPRHQRDQEATWKALPLWSPRHPLPKASLPRQQPEWSSERKDLEGRRIKSSPASQGVLSKI